MPQAKPSTFAVSLKFPAQAAGVSEILKSVLNGIGIRQDRIVETREESETCLTIYSQDYRKTKIIQRKLLGLRLKKVRVDYQRLHTADWQNLWKRDFKPFHLTKRLDVVPIAFKKTYQRNHRHPIYIDTSTAFGTGLHATTKLMAFFIEEKRQRFKSFLDIGTGTGILSIIAHHYGAYPIDAVEIDPYAIPIAKENFRDNGCIVRRLIRNHVKNIPRQRYNFVAANLITQDLVDLKRKIFSFVKPRGYLAVSGISLKNLTYFKESYFPLKLSCLKILKKEGWAGVLYQRTL